MNCGKCENDQKPEGTETEEFKFLVEQFADINIGRFQIPGFDELTVKQKEMLYYLYQAAALLKKFTSITKATAQQKISRNSLFTPSGCGSRMGFTITIQQTNSSRNFQRSILPNW